MPLRFSFMNLMYEVRGFDGRFGSFFFFFFFVPLSLALAMAARRRLVTRTQHPWQQP